MKSIEFIIFALLLSTCSTTLKHRRKVKQYDEKIKRIRKRFDDMQYDGRNFQIPNIMSPQLLSQQTTPGNNNNIQYNTAYIKSSIPVDPIARNNILSAGNIENKQHEIPLGPLVQPDGGDIDGNVHLRDLLTFIRKTNIPEDPFANEVTPAKDLPTSSNLLTQQTNNFAENEEHLEDFFPQAKRFSVPQSQQLLQERFPIPQRFNLPQAQARFNIPQRVTNLWGLQLLNNLRLRYPYLSAMNVRKATIPRVEKNTKKQVYGKQQLAKLSNIATPNQQKLYKANNKMYDNRPQRYKATKLSNIQRQTAQQGNVRTQQDPYEHLKQAITKKDQTVLSKTQANKKSNLPYANGLYHTPYSDYPFNKGYPLNNYYQSNVRKAAVPMAPDDTELLQELLEENIRDDPYEQLKRAISKKEEDLHEHDEAMKKNESLISKKSNIDYSKAPVKYNEPKTYLMQYKEYPIMFRKQNIPTPFNTNNNNDDSAKTKKTEIPGITIEHAIATDSFPLQLRKMPMTIRKDIIPDESNKKEKIISDANNDQVIKKSAIPDVDTPNKEPTGETDLNEGDNNLYTGITSRKSELPSAEDLEKRKNEREMKLIDEMNKMKKSTIPVPDQISEIKKSTIPVLPPDQISELKIYETEESDETKKSTIPYLSAEQQKEMEEMKKSVIPIPASDSYPLVLNKHPAEGSEYLYNAEIPHVEKSLPIQTMISKKSQIPNTFDEVQNVEENQSTETNKDSETKVQDVKKSYIENKLPSTDNQNKENNAIYQISEVSSKEVEASSQDEEKNSKNKEHKSQIPKAYQMSIEEEHQNNNEQKKSEIPERPETLDVVSTDSYPLKLRIYPPN